MAPLSKKSSLNKNQTKSKNNNDDENSYTMKFNDETINSSLKHDIRLPLPPNTSNHQKTPTTSTKTKSPRSKNSSTSNNNSFYMPIPSFIFSNKKNEKNKN